MSTPSKNYVASNAIDTTTGFTDRDEVLVSLQSDNGVRIPIMVLEMYQCYLPRLAKEVF